MDHCNNPPKIGIVGAGFSGLNAGIQLRKQLNIDSFAIFDENEDIGGTWLVNTYPGCACDIPSSLYSLSEEPNPNWSRYYPERKEIWEYLRDIANKYDLYPKIRFNHRVTSCRWDDTTEKWHVSIFDITEGTETVHVFDIVISGIGGLRVPNIPPQFEPFSKPKMHSAQWDSSIQIEDKEVAIIGSGASAIQIIPEIVDKVKKLTVYQRNPAWVVPKADVAIPKWVQWMFATIPGVQWALRNWIFWTNEFNHGAFKKDTFLSKVSVMLANWHLNKQVADPELREKLRPNYQMGCKRIAPSNDYYPALAKPNVKLITSKIADVTEDSIICEDGAVEKPEVLILATGFRVQDFFAPLKFFGKGGEDLFQKWKKTGPCAYAGITCSSTPNCFFLLGPNTGLGHNTVIFSIECQTNFVMQMIREMSKRNAKTVSVKKSAEDEYMNRILEEMKSTVWGAYDCGSWYADHRGVITALYPGTLMSYYWRTRTVNFSHFDFS